MEKKKYLNADIGGSIAELKYAMKEFSLRNKLYRILLRGKGLEFESYREYEPDDDASVIDWKASMRANKLLTKKYRDERNLKIVFIVDVGQNMVLGSAEKLKCEYAAEVVAALAYLIITSGDRVGFVLFNKEVREFIRPLGGKRSFERLVGALGNAETYDSASDIEKALQYVSEYLTPTIDSIVVVSDFISFNEKASMTLSELAKKFETVVLLIRDPLDFTFPEYSTEIVIEDPRTGNQLLINPKIAKPAYEKYAREKMQFLKETCIKNRIDLLELITTKPFVPLLSEFLKGRAKAGGLGK